MSETLRKMVNKDIIKTLDESRKTVLNTKELEIDVPEVGDELILVGLKTETDRYVYFKISVIEVLSREPEKILKKGIDFVCLIMGYKEVKPWNDESDLV